MSSEQNPFSLIRVTILKDKETRESKGVAFVLFLDRQMAQKAVAAVNKKQVFPVNSGPMGV